MMMGSGQFFLFCIILLLFLLGMIQASLQSICVWVVVGYSILGWLVLTGIKINYGRLSHSFLAIQVDPRFGWFFFEVPNLLWVCYFIFVRGEGVTLPYLLFILHYINRDIIYPLSLKTTTKVPLQILLSAFSFTFANGYLQSLANSQADPLPFFVRGIGVILFVGGMAVNIYSDRILQQTKEKLAREKERRYVRIDQFLFKYIANPNYFGEVIEWIGYALVSGHGYAFLFAFSSINVLTPAAMVRSGWNKKNIANYPEQRKAIFPFLL